MALQDLNHLLDPRARALVAAASSLESPMDRFGALQTALVEIVHLIPCDWGGAFALPRAKHGQLEGYEYSADGDVRRTELDPSPSLQDDVAHTPSCFTCPRTEAPASICALVPKDARTLLCVLLRNVHRVNGLLILAKRGAAEFADDECASGIQFAHLLQVAWRKALLYERQRLFRQEVMALDQLAAQVSHLRNPEDTYAAAFDAILPVISFDGGALFLLSDEGDGLILHASRRIPPQIVQELIAHPIALSEGITGRATAGRETIYLENARGDPRLIKREAFDSSGIRSLVAIPLHVGGRVMGVLTLAAHTLRHLSATTLQWLQAAGGIVGVAIANAQLYQDLERRVSERTAELQEATERYRMLAETTPVGILQWDQHCLRFVNSRFLEISGYSREEVLQMPMGMAIDYADRLRIREELMALPVGATLDTPLQVRLRRKSGELRSVEIRMTKQMFGGEMTVMAAMLDVTEREKARQELELQAAELAALNEISTALTTSLDLHSMLDIVLERTLAALDIPAGAVYLLDEEAELLHLVSARGLSPEAVAKLAVRPASIILLRSDVESRLPKIQPLETHPIPEMVALGRSERIVMALGLHLFARDRVVGTIHMATREPREFSERERRLMATIGAQIGASVHHAQLYAQLQTAHLRLRVLSAGMLEKQETERLHLSQALHEDVSQSLTALKLDLQRLQLLLKVNPDHSSTLVAGGISLLDHIVERTRILATTLRTPSLTEFGLVPALGDELAAFEQRSGIRTRLLSSGLCHRLPRETESTLYRIVQEALLNVARHASAHEVIVQMFQERGRVRLIVQDDGIGFDTDRAWEDSLTGRRLGLLTIRERAELLGGTMHIESASGQGTTLIVELPLAPDEGEQA